MQSQLHTASQLRVENQMLTQRLAASKEKLAALQHELAQLKRLIFGTKSERFEPLSLVQQLPLFKSSKGVVLAGKQPRASRLKQHRGQAKRQVLPSHLPREVILIEPEGDITGLKKIGQEVTETLDYRPARLIVIRRLRPKYVDPAVPDGGVRIADLPARPIDKGIAEAGLLAHIVIEKYCDHLPLYRQQQRFAREGITLASSTLGDWTSATAELLVPLYRALGEQALTGGYIQADETPIQVLDRTKKGKTHRGYYWVYHAPRLGLSYLDYQPGRGRDGPGAFLATYQGALQSDGYVVYDDYDKREGITHYNCWAHARRNFHDALQSSSRQAEEALGEIGRLYDIERQLRDSDATPAVRRRARQDQAVPILEAFKLWLGTLDPLPKSPLGKAVNYTLARWDKLRRYTEDGRIEIDNNLVENAIRPIALGRKNYLFAGSHSSAQRAAVIYSLLATCKHHEVNPQIWLTDVLSRVATHPHKRVEELLPHHWKKTSEGQSL